MAYTKYSLTPANNNAAPPDGAPEGMLPSAVNDTMRDMMAQIRDCGDGIRGGTYTMTAPVITGGSINGTTTITTSGAISYSGTLTGGTGVINIGSSQFYKDANGNIGIGVTPSAWSGYTGFQVNKLTNIWNNNASGGTSYYSNNLYWNGTNRIFQLNGYASEYTTGAGTHAWFISSASGTAGGTVTLVEAMRIDANANVSIGTSTATDRLTVVNSGNYAALAVGNGTNSSYFGYVNATSNYVNGSVAGDAAIMGYGGISLGTSSGANTARFDSLGNFAIGTATPTNFGAGYRVITAVGTSGAGVLEAISTSVTARFQAEQSGGGQVYVAAVSNHPIKFLINGTECAQIDTARTFYFNSGYGSSAKAYGCRAWVQFNGSTGAINASGNVSSVSHPGTGQNVVNFAANLVDTNYSVVVSGYNTVSSDYANYASNSTSSVTINTFQAGGTFANLSSVSVAIHR
jgi:hypothetical protein